MIDLWHYYGGDLAQSATGDLLGVDGTVKGQQRILRRLLTNPGDYLWHPDYGAGLPAKVGDVFDAAKIRALIRGQILLEAAVARSPEPVIDVQQIPSGLSVNIQYNDAPSGARQTLSFNVTA